MPKHDLKALATLATRALTEAGASRAMADATVRALMYAEARGLPSHGLSRVLQYTTHLRNGRANGAAVASVSKGKPAACLVDADEGLAFPACELAISEGIARVYGASASVNYQKQYPVTVNHEHQTAFAADVAREIVGRERVDPNTPPRMAGEDFSFMLEARPGALVLLGAGEGEGLHHPGYNFNDAIIPLGTSFWARLVERAMPAQ